jgi:hypothetical protein
MEDRRGACRVSLIELRERDDLNDIGVDDRVVLKLIVMINDGGVDCVDRDKWRAVVNAVMNLQVP